MDELSVSILNDSAVSITHKDIQEFVNNEKIEQVLLKSFNTVLDYAYKINDEITLNTLLNVDNLAEAGYCKTEASICRLVPAKQFTLDWAFFDNLGYLLCNERTLNNFPSI